MTTAGWENLVSLAHRLSGRSRIPIEKIVRGETFAWQGKPSEHVFLIHSGLIEHGWQPNKNLVSDLDPEDSGTWVGWSGPGSIIGLESLSPATGRTYDYSLTAVSDCEVIRIRARDLTPDRLALDRGRTNVSDILHAALEEQTRKLSKLASAFVEFRQFTNQAVFARVLLELADCVDPHGSKVGNVVLLPDIAQSSLLSASGRNDSTLSSVMAEFAKRRIVDWGGLGHPCILDRERLELIALNGRRLGDLAYDQTVQRARELLGRGANGEVIALSRDMTGEPIGDAKKKEGDGWTNFLPNGLELALLECIALARIGDTKAARKLASKWGFDGNPSTLRNRISATILAPKAPWDEYNKSSSIGITTGQLDLDRQQQKRAREILIDSQAVVGRILKDVAFHDTTAPTFGNLIRQARDAYARAAGVPADPFAEINRLTLSAILGELDPARAEALVDKIGRTASSYWLLATLAEAFMLLGRMDEAKSALQEALACKDALVGHVSSTRRQMTRLASLPGWSSAGELLAKLPVPHVVAYSGHMMLGSQLNATAQGQEEAKLRPKIAEYIAKSKPSAAFGALAAGSDILIAEAMLDAGVELNVILPMRFESFLKLSVDRGDPPGSRGHWAQRFRDCLSRARSVAFAETDGNVAVKHHDSLFREASRMAVGQAVLRADEWSGTMSLLAVWDGDDPIGIAGTAMAVADARRAGLNVDVLECRWRKSRHAVGSASYAELIASAVLVANAGGRFDSERIIVTTVEKDDDLLSLSQNVVGTASAAAVRMRDPVRAAELAMTLSNSGRRVACHRGLQIDDVFRKAATDAAMKDLRKLMMAFGTLGWSNSRPIATEHYAAILRPLAPGVRLQSLGPSAMLKPPGQGKVSPILGTRRLFLME